MAGYNEFLYDDIGNKYPRKNLYLLDLAVLANKMRAADKAARQELQREYKQLLGAQAEHPYNLELQDFRHKEKAFLHLLQKKQAEYATSFDDPPRLKRLKLKLFSEQEKLEFYRDYISLTYDAELAFYQAQLSLQQLPEIIEYYEANLQKLQEAREARKNFDGRQEKELKEELSQLRHQQKAVQRQEIQRLRRKRKSGLISKKAESLGIKDLKQKYRDLVEGKSLALPRASNKELRRKLRYNLREGVRRRRAVLQADIADLRRKTPVEVKKTKPLIAYFTFFCPGLGQFLNGQLEKGFLFLLASCFAYFAAVPYALGYGNYQGDGLAGLISLAAGGPRIFQSLIFMIEGIISIFLVIIALGLFYFSFRDVLSVEKKMIQGIRPKNWYEVKTGIKDEGFPYLVSVPALLVIIFIVLVPVVTTILISFTSMSPRQQSRFSWIGIKNYRMLFLGQGLVGSVFWKIFLWTIIWTLAATTLTILIGFTLALLANNERVVGKRFFRTVYLLPWAVPAFITIMFFSIMFSPNGILTELISGLLGGIKVHVKTDAQLTRLVLILIQGWLGSAYVFLLTTGVLQAIPKDLYEAADIDGATDWQKTRRITIPIVLFQIAPLLITQYTFNFNNFSIIYLFNGGGPFNPSKYGNLAGSSDILISYIFKLTMVNQQQAVGAAITIVISLGLMLFAYIGFKNSKAFKEERL